MSDPSVDKLIRVFVKIRDARSDLKAKFNEEDAHLLEQQEKIKRALLERCEETGADSIKTADGTAIRSVRKKYWANDWAEVHKFVLEAGRPDLLEKRLNQTVAKELLAEDPDAGSGWLQVDSEFTMSVRKPRK